MVEAPARTVVGGVGFADPAPEFWTLFFVEVVAGFAGGLDPGAVALVGRGGASMSPRVLVGGTCLEEELLEDIDLQNC